jgi:arylsulfatase A-like enzyme
MRLILATLCCLSFLQGQAHAAEQPNVVIIFADDLGYGDVSCYGATKIKTPNIDQLAERGVRFTQAYTNGSVCSPSRYGLLTGRYAWRSDRHPATRVMSSAQSLAFEADRMTLAAMLQHQGYTTGCIGKWHLGFGEGGLEDKYDWTAETLEHGPRTAGFDYFFGSCANLLNEPRVLIENEQYVGREPGDELTMQGRRVIPWSPDAAWVLEDVNAILTEKAVRFIERSAGPGRDPFFLYYASTIPHGPVTPNARYVGSSECGPYGDFLQELDAQVGMILTAIENAGVADNTLVLFTSDNGGVALDEERRGAEQVWEAQQAGHKTCGDLRGHKISIYEGGFRVPFIVRWPGVVSGGATNTHVVSIVDVMATVAELLNVKLPESAAEDSFSLLDVLRRGDAAPAPRDHVILQSSLGMRAIRRGKWKYMRPWTVPAGVDLAVERERSAVYLQRETSNPENYEQLYDLKADPAETTNLFDEQADVAARLRAELDQAERRGGTRGG